MLYNFFFSLYDYFFPPTLLSFQRERKYINVKIYIYIYIYIVCIYICLYFVTE